MLTKEEIGRVCKSTFHPTTVDLPPRMKVSMFFIVLFLLNKVSQYNLHRAAGLDPVVHFITVERHIVSVFMSTKASVTQPRDQF